MKTPHYLLLSGASIVLSSCAALKSVQQPLSSDGSFDPLEAPGAAKKKSSSSSDSSSSFSAPTATSYTPGQWVETSMPNSTFFKVIPKGNATADKVLQAGVPLKFISAKGSYIKVELNSGKVGYIPEIMVIERSATSKVNSTPPPPLPSTDDTVPTSDPFVPPSGLVPAPTDPTGASVLPDIPTIPNEAPAVPSVPEIPSAPSIPDVPSAPSIPDAPSVPSIPDAPSVPGPSSVTLPGVPSPPAVDGITVPSKTD